MTPEQIAKCRMNIGAEYGAAYLKYCAAGVAHDAVLTIAKDEWEKACMEYAAAGRKRDADEKALEAEIQAANDNPSCAQSPRG